MLSKSSRKFAHVYQSNLQAFQSSPRSRRKRSKDTLLNYEGAFAVQISKCSTLPPYVACFPC